MDRTFKPAGVRRLDLAGLPGVLVRRIFRIRINRLVKRRAGEIGGDGDIRDPGIQPGLATAMFGILAMRVTAALRRLLIGRHNIDQVTEGLAEPVEVGDVCILAFDVLRWRHPKRVLVLANRLRDGQGFPGPGRTFADV